MELWEALSNRRKEIGMQFDELHRKTDLSVSTLKKILGGHVSAPSFDSVRAIAYAMDITMAELDRRIEDESKAANPNTATFSPAALALASIYDSLDDHGKCMLDTVAKLESERMEEKPLPKGLVRMSDLPLYPIKYLGDALCDGTIETKYAAKQELRELRESSQVDLVPEHE